MPRDLPAEDPMNTCGPVPPGRNATLVDALFEHGPDFLLGNVLPWRSALEHAAAAKRAGRRVGFTNGVFDLLHLGHVRFLSDCRDWVDYLMVAVNMDSSVAVTRKGPGRPVVGYWERAQLVASLKGVDCVTLFPTPDPCELLAAVRPHVYFKGADWCREDLPEMDVLHAYGGTLQLVDLVPDCSTTLRLSQIRAGLSAQGMAAMARSERLEE